MCYAFKCIRLQNVYNNIGKKQYAVYLNRNRNTNSYLKEKRKIMNILSHPVRTTQLVAHYTGTTEVVGSNVGKGKDFCDLNLNCNNKRTDRQTYKFFDTIYGGMWIFSFS